MKLEFVADAWSMQNFMTKMKTYKVRLIEVSSRVIEVVAPNEDEAIYAVRGMYAEEEIVLDYTDHDYADYEIEE
jgi:hypothetical protein